MKLPTLFRPQPFNVQQLHPHRWHPIGAGLAMLVIDWGIMNLLSASMNKKWTWSQWASINVGDTLCLPLMAALVVAGQEESEATDHFYMQPWWHVLLLTVGCSISIGREIQANRSGKFTRDTQITRTNLYHATIFGPLFYFFASGAVPFFRSRASIRLKLPALLATLGYFATLGYDLHLVRRGLLPLPDTKY